MEKWQRNSGDKPIVVHCRLEAFGPCTSLYIFVVTVNVTICTLDMHNKCVFSLSPPHCSGGCGRTGTYIAMCLLIDRLKTEGLVDVFQVVRQLRLQRPGMVRSVVSLKKKLFTKAVIPCAIKALMLK